MQPNFEACGQVFLNHSTDIYSNYTYNGSVRGILQTNRPALITVEGCRHLCGTGNAYYPWADASSTITTWVLPILGLLLQAPYESNELRKTLNALARWVGSPVSSLSYVLWNIKVTAKCALMVDMASPYKEYPDENSQFAQIRDSLYILGVMNQFSIKERMPPIEAERLLRIALFSDSLQLVPVPDDTRNLVKRRRQLAKSIRENRKRGVVPVFISLMWFLFSMAISIQQAFGQMGDNETAHDLAMGLILAWLPVLILSSIVDRNPGAAEDMRLKFNALLDDVRTALLDPGLRDTYVKDTQRTADDFAWTKKLNDEDCFRGDFFTDFAGQGRIRWHYGVAHPILSGIEESFVADYGRDWLKDAEWARTKLVVGPKTLIGLRSFDFREIWQILSAVVIVASAAGGAFIISYFTPTVGLGCRSGGYMIFMIISLGVYMIEILCWWLIPEGTAATDDPIARFGQSVERTLSRTPSNSWRMYARRRVKGMLSRWTDMSWRDQADTFVIWPIEVFNSVWLTYIVFAQTFGSYQNCNCMSSIWGGQQGYMDFQAMSFYRELGIDFYYGFGTGLSLVIMSIAIAYVVEEWCTQSHLSTDNYENAMKGLSTTRLFKKYTSSFRDFPDHIITSIMRLKYRLTGGHGRAGRRSLVWASKTRRHGIPEAKVCGWELPPRSNEKENLLDEAKGGALPSVSTQRINSFPPAHSRSRTPSQDSSFEEVFHTESMKHWPSEE